MLFPFMFVFYMNLNKIWDALDLISLDNINLLNKWMCEEHNLLNGYNFFYEIIGHTIKQLSRTILEKKFISNQKGIKKAYTILCTKLWFIKWIYNFHIKHIRLVVHAMSRARSIFLTGKKKSRVCLYF